MVEEKKERQKPIYQETVNYLNKDGTPKKYVNFQLSTWEFLSEDGKSSKGRTLGIKCGKMATIGKNTKPATTQAVYIDIDDPQIKKHLLAILKL